MKVTFYAEGAEPITVGPFGIVQVDDCSIYVLNDGEPDVLAEWSYGEGGVSGYTIEPPYGDGEGFFPFARVEQDSAS